ncbi:HNH endonuclease [Streptomyces sp. NBC_01205]|uniref:HNH endonuclease n=1 Tax=Streptomyces sp. NBC_01205 TaxID=2903771 RepID=UPI002E13F299|nr:HNH endonuclease [Streptomyces sp. NBC_01205]
MWHLNPPSHSAKDSWETCTSSSRDTRNNAGLGTKLRQAAEIAQKAADTYRDAAQSHTLHDLDPTAFKIDGIPDRAVSDVVYQSGMVGGPGRWIYDALMDAPEDDLCPLCRHTDATQLDHVMPKADYPALCVDPQNLVPVCGICNHAKSSRAPSEAAKVLLHPYFDRAGHENWLDATVIPGSGGRLRYFVTSPPTWDNVFRDRVRHHFDFLKLGKRYGNRANSTLTGMRLQFLNWLADDAGGPSGLRTHLESLASSHFTADLNSWTAVAYRAWAADDAFCKGSFAHQPSPDGP